MSTTLEKTASEEKPKVTPEQIEAMKKAREEAAKQPRQFVSFAFYKLDPAFRRELSVPDRNAAVEELAQVVDSARQKFLLYPYSTLGIRPETDFLLWRISYRMEDFEEMTAQILQTRMGQYLETPYSFFSMTKTSIYVDDHIHDEQESTRNRIVVGGRKYLFVYPFVKTRAWYNMSAEERMNAMREHIRVGHEYPSVKLNTTYSFGLDDQEFVVAFETDAPQDFLDLVQRLRETEASAYTLRDTPTITCIRQDVRTILAHVAGVAAE